MTPQEELLYLSDLLMQAALWRVDQEDGKCCLELEVESRLTRLREEINKGHASAIKEIQKEYDKDWKRRKRETHRLLKSPDDGKMHWYPKEECVKIKVPFGVGYKWTHKDWLTGNEDLVVDGEELGQIMTEAENEG